VRGPDPARTAIYALTFSLADGNEAQARHALATGMNVAAVFAMKAALPLRVVGRLPMLSRVQW